MEVVGYAIIKNDATTGVSAAPLKEFLNTPVRVLEFGSDGCVMVLNSSATGIAIFDKCDIVTSFRCGKLGIVIIPPDLNTMEAMIYAGNAMARKGGYNDIVSKMVVASSLHKGAFSDSFLWSKQ